MVRVCAVAAQEIGAGPDATRIFGVFGLFAKSTGPTDIWPSMLDMSRPKLFQVTCSVDVALAAWGLGESPSDLFGFRVSGFIVQ